jgi:hypothetical protein
MGSRSRQALRKGLIANRQRTLWLLTVALLSCGPPPYAGDVFTLTQQGRASSGTFGSSAAEIPAFCPQAQNVFVVNAESGRVDVFSLKSDGTLFDRGTITARGDLQQGMAAVNSVSVFNGTLAVAVEAAEKTEPGAVVFYDTKTLALKGSVMAGSLPDMVTFSPNGRWLLVANEGEPNETATVDPEGTITIVDLAKGFDDPPVTTVTFRDWNTDGRRAAELPDLMKRGLRHFGTVSLDQTGGQSRPATFAEDMEPEWITVSPDSRHAYVCLQEANAVAEIDIAEARVDRIIPLGFKDHGLEGMGLDVSDKDSAVAIKPWPQLFGVYQPDAIRLYQQGGRTLLVTANEGDSRLRPTSDDAVPGIAEGKILSDEASLNDWPVAGTPFASYTSDTQLGRLKLVRDLVDRHLDTEGKPTKLFCFGGRSFSIFDVTSGHRIFDSGDAFEKMTAERFPKHFNVSNDSLKTEKRSRSKGPEPEALVLGEIAGRTYAFIGLERIGGIMVYDITIPESSRFVGYFTNRRFDVPATLPDGSSNPEAGDSGPEGLAFVPAAQSPTGTDLLIVANETSGTTTVWNITAGDE